MEVDCKELSVSVYSAAVNSLLHFECYVNDHAITVEYIFRFSHLLLHSFSQLLGICFNVLIKANIMQPKTIYRTTLKNSDRQLDNKK